MIDDNDPIYDPDDRPGDDISDDSMSSARRKAEGCAICAASGWATVYHCNYTGEPIIQAWDGYGYKTKVMRSVAYCTCAAGRKMKFLHEDHKDKASLRRVADAHDILAGRHPEWGFDDPNHEELTASEISKLPPRWREKFDARFGKP